MEKNGRGVSELNSLTDYSTSRAERILKKINTA